MTRSRDEQATAAEGMAQMIAGLPVDTAVQSVIDALYREAIGGDVQAGKFLLVNLRPANWRLQPTTANPPTPLDGEQPEAPAFALRLTGAAKRA